MTFDAPAISRHRVRLARQLARVGGGVFLAALLFAAAAVVFGWRNEVADVSVWAFCIWSLPYFASYAVWFLRGSRAGRVSVDAEAVELSTLARIPRREVVSAYVIARPAGIFVEIVRTGGDVFAVEVANDPQGQALVQALGFGPGGKRQVIDLAAPGRRLLHLALGYATYQAASMLATIAFAVVGIGFDAHFVGIALVVPPLYLLLRRAIRPPTIEVGDDGIAVVRGTSRTFRPRASVRETRLKLGTTSVAVVTTDGGFLVSGVLLDGDRSRAAVAAVRSRWATPIVPPARVASFLREGRDLGAWQHELRVRIATGGYRDGSVVTVEDAAAVLHSAAAPADARLGAALALAAAGERVRIADAAAPITDAALREVVEAIAEGRDEPRKLAALLQRG